MEIKPKKFIGYFGLIISIIILLFECFIIFFGEITFLTIFNLILLTFVFIGSIELIKRNNDETKTNNSNDSKRLDR